MKIYIECCDRDWPKIRWAIIDVINRKDWKGTVDLEGPEGSTRMVARKCTHCAAFKAHRTMRQRRGTA